MASCWAMGRSSVDATKACLMRAVRAVRAALPARGAGFLWELEADGLAAGPDFFAAVDFADVAGFFAAVDFPAAIGFLADFAFEEGDEVEVAGFAFVSPEDCAATGVTLSLIHI